MGSYIQNRCVKLLVIPPALMTCHICALILFFKDGIFAILYTLHTRAIGPQHLIPLFRDFNT